MNLISSSFKGSTIKHSSKEGLSKIKLKIPKNKKLIKDIEPLFQEIEKLQTEMKEAESQYKQLIKELSEEAIPTTTLVVVLPDNKTYEDNIKVKETKKNKPKVDDLIENNIELPVSKKKETKKNKSKVDDLIEDNIEILVSKKKVTKNKVKIISNDIDI